MNQKFNKRSKEKKIFWADKIQAWKKSGLPQSEYCNQNNLDQQLFSKWKIRLQKANSFIEVMPGFKNIAVDKDVELIVKDVYKIKIKPDFNEESLKKILSILGEEK